MPRLVFAAWLAVWLAACAQVLGLDDPTGRDGAPGADPDTGPDAAIDADLPDAAIPRDHDACPPGLTCDRAYPIGDSDIVLRGTKYGYCRSPST